ncbi:MAG: hypothetical protein GYA36_19120 [Veillonellaceae bacterium]|nr:hypothetical protein [Veillonellaceae bacterium]
MKKTTKKTAPMMLKLLAAPDSAIHLPKAFPFGKNQYYGMTALLTPIAVTATSGDSSVGPLVTFKTGLSFCSPQDVYNGKKGVARASHRMCTHCSFELIVPLKDICRPRGLEKAIMKHIEMVFPDYGEPEGLRGRAKDYGFPMRLLHYRHAHRKQTNHGAG